MGTALWTWGGRYFGRRDGDDLWTYGGRHVGRFHGAEVYGADGRYLGEVRSGDRLITNTAKRPRRRAGFSPRAPRVGHVPYVGRVGHVMHVGCEDFPAPSAFD